jgi:hypothetical protein
MAILQPLDNDNESIFNKLQVVGTFDHNNAYSVEYCVGPNAQKGKDQCYLIADGNGPVVNDVLATFDPQQIAKDNSALTGQGVFATIILVNHNPSGGDPTSIDGQVVDRRNVWFTPQIIKGGFPAYDFGKDNVGSPYTHWVRVGPQSLIYVDNGVLKFRRVARF